MSRINRVGGYSSKYSHSALQIWGFAATHLTWFQIKVNLINI